MVIGLRQQRANPRAQVETAPTVAAARAVDDPRMASHRRKQTPEVAYQLAPRRWRKLQSLQDRRYVIGGCTAFARHRLPGGPVQQLQVVLHRHGQEPFIAAAGATGIAARSDLATVLVKLQWGQEPVRSERGIQAGGIRRLAGGSRRKLPRFAARSLALARTIHKWDFPCDKSFSSKGLRLSCLTHYTHHRR